MPIILIFNHPALLSMQQFEIESTTNLQDIPYTDKDVNRSIQKRLTELMEDADNFDDFMMHCIAEQFPHDFLIFLEEFKEWIELKVAQQFEAQLMYIVSNDKYIDSMVKDAIRSMELMGDDGTASVVVQPQSKPKKKKSVITHKGK